MQKVKLACMQECMTLIYAAVVFEYDNKPWQIIEGALEEYVVRHYGKEHRRK